MSHLIRCTKRFSSLLLRSPPSTLQQRRCLFQLQPHLTAADLIKAQRRELSWPLFANLRIPRATVLLFAAGTLREVLRFSGRDQSAVELEGSQTKSDEPDLIVGYRDDPVIAPHFSRWLLLTPVAAAYAAMRSRRWLARYAPQMWSRGPTMMPSDPVGVTFLTQTALRASLTFLGTLTVLGLSTSLEILTRYDDYPFDDVVQHVIRISAYATALAIQPYTFLPLYICAPMKVVQVYGVPGLERFVKSQQFRNAQKDPREAKILEKIVQELLDEMKGEIRAEQEARETEPRNEKEKEERVKIPIRDEDE